MGNKSMIFGHVDGAGVAQRENVAVANAKALNVAASAVIKATPGRVCRVIVTTAGSAPGAIHDFAATSGTSAATLVATIPNTVGIYDISIPCAVGITYILGTGQVCTVSYI